MNSADNIITMLRGVEAERKALKDRDVELAKREQLLRTWLAEESNAPKQKNLAINTDGNPLSKFLLATLASGKSFTAVELGELAKERGLIANAIPGRAAHGTLMGLQKRDLARRSPDGFWSKK